MAKVVTSEGLTEFVQSGKFTHVENHKPGKSTEAPPLEVKRETSTTDIGEKPKADEAKDEPKEVKTESDEGLDAEEQTYPEKLRKAIGRRVAALRAQEAMTARLKEEAAENERFAEQQFNERKLIEGRETALQERLRELEGKQAKPVEPELKEPDIKNYTNETGQVDWVKFQKDTSTFAAKQAVAEERARQAQERGEAEQAEAAARVKANADKARKAHPDFDKVMSSIANTDADRVPQFVLNYIFESETGAEIAYHLAKNPEESKRIAQLKPILGLAELGKLADTLSKPANPNNGATAATPPARERGGAPPPITPLSGSGSGSVNTDPAKMSFKELRAYERERARSKH
jgi:hypothetical protein